LKGESCKFRHTFLHNTILYAPTDQAILADKDNMKGVADIEQSGKDDDDDDDDNSIRTQNTFTGNIVNHTR